MGTPSSTQSFATTIELLQRACPTAVYDDRLALPGALSGKAARLASISSDQHSTAPAIDLLAHALSLWLRKRAAPTAKLEP